MWLLLFFKGMAMGAADVVPGVSGGTIAFITGIYQRLLKALTQINLNSLIVLRREGLEAFWQAIDGRFLITLFAGVLFSILTLAKLINYALENFAIGVWAFFFGLVLASVLFLYHQVPRWRWAEYSFCALGIVMALLISIARPAELPSEWWMMAIAGFIAICAMILPGISGSFLLLLMGMYGVVIRALSELDWLLLFSFAMGCGIGLLVFSHILTWLLKRYYSQVLSLLIGFLAGSLNVLWPWKHVLETTTNRHNEIIPLVQVNVMPGEYEVLHQLPAYLLAAILLMGVGFLIVFCLEKLGKTFVKE